MRNDSGPVPIIAAMLGVCLLTIMDGVIKGLAPHYPTSVIVFMRLAFGGVVALAVYLAAGAPRLAAETVKMAALRAVFIVATAALFFAALGLLPLAEVIALSFLSPIMLALFGRIFLGERIAPPVVIGIALGALGTLVMIADQVMVARTEARSVTGVVYALASTVTYAASQILLRARATRDPLPSLVLLQTWLPAFLIAPFAVPVLVLPPMDHVTLFAVIGVLGTTGHLLLTFAFARANAARIGVVEYTAFAWAAVIGYVWFAEVPSLATYAGVGLIVAGALAVACKGARAEPMVSPEPARTGAPK
jgi:drug/metabolite transporter (DMT)-like permease